MFRQEKVKLTLDYAHPYCIEDDAPHTTTQTWRKQITSIRQLEEDYNSFLDEFSEMEQSLRDQKYEYSHNVEITISGNFKGQIFTNLVINDLNVFYHFILTGQLEPLNNSPKNQANP